MPNKAIDFLILASLSDTEEETLAYFNKARESEDYEKAVEMLDKIQSEEKPPEKESESPTDDVTDYKGKKMME